jgi:hypothetical protein
MRIVALVSGKMQYVYFGKLRTVVDKRWHGCTIRFVKTWTERQADTIVKEAKARWGASWNQLSESQQRGEVAMGIVALMMAQDEESSSPLLLKLQQVAASVDASL